MIQEVLQKKPTAMNVIGLSFTSMRHAIVLLDGEDPERFFELFQLKGIISPPLLAISNIDPRASSEAQELRELLDVSSLYEVSGRYPSPICAAAKLLHLKKTLSAEWTKVSAFLPISEWVNFFFFNVHAISVGFQDDWQNYFVIDTSC